MSVFCKRCSNCRVHDGSSGSAWAEVTGVALVPKWLVIKLAISISIPSIKVSSQPTFYA